jgi:hypothetical protein
MAGREVRPPNPKEEPIMSTRNTTNIARACLVGSALVILSASLAQAEYGPRTTIGANYQQTSTTTSINGIAEGSCNGNSVCFILFQVTPAQKPLIVQHVSCTALVSAGGLTSASLRTRMGQTFPIKRTALLPVNLTSTISAVNSPVMHLFESGERAVVILGNNGVIANWSFVECNISGQLKQP